MAAIVAAAVASIAHAGDWTPTRQQLNDRRHTVMDRREAKCLKTWALKPLLRNGPLTPAQLRWKWAWWKDVRDRTADKPNRCWPAHHALWLCIHSREGDWEDGGWPYWGGLQMGAWFMDAYGTWGEPQGYTGPNGWTNAPSQLQQEQAAERGYRASGYSTAWLFGQWPNTAPPCV